LYALSEIEWHQRVWTYQEAFLAKNARVLAEGLNVDWDHVVAPTTGLLWAMHDDEIFEQIDAEATIVGLPARHDRMTWQFKWLQVGRSRKDVGMRNLISGLISTQNRESTVAKDKVYGLLAVIRSDVSAQIPIDYTTTDGEVFATAVKADLEYEPAETISTLWEYSDGNLSAIEDLPSWCPNFASVSGSINAARHYRVPAAVKQQTSAFTCYDHSPGFQTIRVKVLKLDTTAGCVDVACPLDEARSHISPPSDIEASLALEASLKHWLVQLGATLFDDGSTLGLTREVTAFLHGTSDHKSLVSFETFWETLNHMLLFADSDLQPLFVYDHRRDWAKYRDTLTILSSQSGRYLFKTPSGWIGFGTRRPTPGNHVVILPGAGRMYMLTRDCTQYSGIVSLSGVGEDDLLDLVKARENMWETVELR
jgi:hypothetical protein